MTQTNTSQNTQTRRFRTAFERQLPVIRGAPESEFDAINVDLESSVATALGAWPEIRALRDPIAKEASGFDITLPDNLQSNALALRHAQTEYQATTNRLASLVALGNEAINWRATLLNDMNTLISRSHLSESATPELKGLSGHKNIASNLSALANGLKKAWETLSTTFEKIVSNIWHALSD